jgi:hypothetical protein
VVLTTVDLPIDHESGGLDYDGRWRRVVKD